VKTIVAHEAQTPQQLVDVAKNQSKNLAVNQGQEAMIDYNNREVHVSADSRFDNLMNQI